MVLAALVLIGGPGMGCRAPAGAARDQKELHQGAAPAAASGPAPVPRSEERPRNRAGWRAALEWPADCEDAFQASNAGTGDEGIAVNQLEPRLALIEVLCAAGAYQPSHVYVLFDERGTVSAKTVLRFSVYHTEDGRSLASSMETELWGESVVSPQSRELSVLTVSRQLADCGIWSRYRIGTDPTLIAAAARLPCPAAPGSPAESTDGGPPPGWRPIRLRR
jgi:hypothetical protein